MALSFHLIFILRLSAISFSKEFSGEKKFKLPASYKFRYRNFSIPALDAFCPRLQATSHSADAGQFLPVVQIGAFTFARIEAARKKKFASAARNFRGNGLGFIYRTNY